MEKTSKVTSCQANGSWTGNYGTMYKFELAFENGDTGEYSSKSPDQKKFVLGQDATYTIDNSNPKYPKIKPVFSNNGGFKGGGFKSDPKRELRIVKQSSLKVAVDYLSAKGVNMDLNDVFKTADKIVEWVMEDTQVQNIELRTGVETNLITRKEAKSKVANEMENFAEQSGQTMHPQDLPF